MTAVDIFGPASSLNSVTARPSDGRYYTNLDSFFKDCTTPSSQDGTQVTAGWLNQVTGVLRMLARANGLKVDGINSVVPYDQTDAMILNAIEHLIQRGRANYAPDQGAVNALAIVLPVTPAELLDGLPIWIKIANTNTAPATLTLTGFSATPYPVVRQDGSALASGDLIGGGFAGVRFDASFSKFRVHGLVKSDAATTIGSGEGVQIASGAALLDVPDLTAQPAIAGTDLFPFFSIGDNHHRKTPFSNIASLLASSTSLTNVFVSKAPNAAAVSITYGMSGNQTIASNTNTQVALTGSATPFCTISGGSITITGTGLYLVSGTLLGNTNQPSGQLQYSSLIIYKNGILLTQTTISNYSFGSVLVALNVTDGAYFTNGDVVTMVFYTHSQANNDTGDSVTASGTSLTLVKVG